MSADLLPWVDRLRGRRVLVVGDVILDEYLIGRPTRMSREAPVPVLEYVERQYIPGGAANPAANIVALGGEAHQIGLIGRDAAAQHLRQALDARGIHTDGLLTCEDRPTTVKTRIMAQMGLRFPQQVARVDVVNRQPLSPAAENELLQGLEATLARVDAVLLSDYHGGLLTSTLVNALRERAKAHRLTADTQGMLDKYAGFDLVKCNADDAAAYLGRTLNDDAAFAQAVRDLREGLRLRGAMVITRGSAGATLADAEGVAHCPAPAVSDVYDTVGAGDTAIAVMTLALSAGADAETAVRLANAVSGIVVRHVGNYTPSPDEVRAALSE